MSKPRTPKDYEETVERLLEEARRRDIRFAEREPEQGAPEGVSRRALLQMGALAGAGASVAGMLGGVPADAQGPADGTVAEAGDSAKAGDPGPHEFNDLTISELQALMGKKHLNAEVLTLYYLQRIHDIDRRGPRVNTVIEVNPDAIKIARALDAERRTKGPRGPLHGIPVLVKDNYDSADKMQTTAGSLGMIGPAPAQDSTCVARLRAAGAVLMGKTNLSEWANFRSTSSSSGWSGRGGQTNNPYVLDRNPSGSSSGSAASVSANFTAVGLGTETDGSIVSPATNSGVVGIHPTLGLTSRAGVIPISHHQDVTGPHARTVADAAAVLSALVGVDPRDPATAASAGKFSTDYTQFLDKNGLKGARIGVMRQVFTGYSAKTDAILEEAIAAMKSAGAVIVDPADLPTAQQLVTDPSETIVLVYDFKRDLNAYLATRPGLAVHSLADLVDVDHFLGASSTPAAVAGYPNITVNAGYSFGLPVGLSFMGPAFTEPTLITIAYAFEQTIQQRQQPKFFPSLPTLPFGKSADQEEAARIAARIQDAIAGTTPNLPFRLRNL